MKGILFDFNGTMFFDSIKHKEAWNAFSLKYRNKALSDEEMDHMHGPEFCSCYAKKAHLTHKMK